MNAKFSNHSNEEMLKLTTISAQRLCRFIEIKTPTVILNQEVRILIERLQELDARQQKELHDYEI